MRPPVYTDENVHMWEIYPHTLQWHKHHRKFISEDLPGQPRNHINALLIMSSAIMLEGAISSLLLFYLKGPFSPYLSAINVHSKEYQFNERNRELLISGVNEGTWSKYPNLFRVITGESLSELTAPYWKDITYLFQFRNLLAHGGQINIRREFDRSQGLKLNHSKRDREGLFKYLEEKNLLEDNQNFGKKLGFSFLSDEIADHFVSTARSFISVLAAKTPDPSTEYTFPKRMAAVLEQTKIPDAGDNINFYKD